jgi:hypothetical protein
MKSHFWKYLITHLNYYISVIEVLILVSCNQSTTHNSSKQLKNNYENGNDSIKRITITVNEMKFIQLFLDDKFYGLLSEKGDTIIRSDDSYIDAKFVDIDCDGSKDIQISFYSVSLNERNNYFFDTKKKTFREIENSNLYLQKIRGTNLYYSYDTESCSDLNWVSYLSEIKDYKQIDIGYMYGQGCDEDLKNYPQKIEIYQVVNSDSFELKLKKTINYQKHIPKNEDKWEFIETYWNRNYHAFTKKNDHL